MTIRATGLTQLPSYGGGRSLASPTYRQMDRLVLTRPVVAVAAIAALLGSASLVQAQSDNERQELLRGGATKKGIYNILGFDGTDFGRTTVRYESKYPPGTIVIDTAERKLYLIQGNGSALRYGIGVGRVGFQWKGTHKISAKKEFPDWTPPPEMIARQPYLPRFMAGGETNPLGARALYLGNTVYRIHGTNQPSTIGTFVSSGCIRLTNEDVMDLYRRVRVGTLVVVLLGAPPPVVRPPVEASVAPVPDMPLGNERVQPRPPASIPSMTAR